MIACMDSETEYETKCTQNRKTVEQKLKKCVFNFTECGASFHKNRELKMQTNSEHLKLRPFKCNECRTSYIRNDKLKKHTNSVHLKLRPTY